MEGQPRCQVIETGPVEHVCGSGKTFKSPATGMRANKMTFISIAVRFQIQLVENMFFVTELNCPFKLWRICLTDAMIYFKTSV